MVRRYTKLDLCLCLGRGKGLQYFNRFLKVSLTNKKRQGEGFRANGRHTCRVFLQWFLELGLPLEANVSLLRSHPAPRKAPLKRCASVTAETHVDVVGHMTRLAECLWHWHEVALIVARKRPAPPRTTLFWKAAIHARGEGPVSAGPLRRRPAALGQHEPGAPSRTQALTAATSAEQDPVWAQRRLWCWPLGVTSFSSWELPSSPTSQLQLHIFLLLEPNQTRLYK